MKKKIFSVILLLIILLSSTCLAATISSERANLEIVENNVCTINITDTSIFEKKLVDYNLEKKELLISLKVTNNAVAPLDKPSEIVLVIDNSLSMGETISTGGTRMEAVADSAKLLATELLKLDTVKLSVVSFSTGSNEGTITDAKLRTEFTDSEEVVLAAITEVENDATGVRTDIEAGITLASQQFTGTCDSKFIILLTDGVPNISLGSNSIIYSGVTAANTKDALIEIDGKGIEILSMMTGVTNSIESQTGKTYKELAEEVFGTPEQPTVGKFYYITDDEIEETVSETILNQLIAPEDDILNDIVVYDYFPQEIVDNFTFEYVDSANVGTVSEDIDLQNNLIEWKIDKLGYGESATLSYKLTLKDNINDEIINQILKTNEKVEITVDNIADILTSDVASKIKLTLEPEPEPEPDNTIIPDPLPQTGSTSTFTFISIVSVILCISIGIRLFIKNREIK